MRASEHEKKQKTGRGVHHREARASPEVLGDAAADPDAHAPENGCEKTDCSCAC